MKMQDNNGDEDLVQFFQEMKEEDRKIPLPPFPNQKNPKLWYLIPIGIAASLALGFLLLPHEDQVPSPPTEVIIITLEEDEKNNQQIRIEEKTYLETWESPTTSLLTKF
ncbi:hypothetical protein [Aquiflexum sp.]|uniref:hypothetical protein n=1 Tax=Aquiflexum sp. TaxID=1872584 RepID=UPI0035936088